MRTILQLSSTSGPGGAEMVVHRLAKRLDGKRCRSVVALFRDGWLRERCARDGIRTEILGMRGALDWGWLRRAVELIRRENVEVIHAHEFTANTYGSLLGMLTGVPVVATVHGKSYYCDRWKRRLAYRWVSRVSKMVTVSEDSRRFLTASVGIPARRIAVVHNGVDPEDAGREACAGGLREELGISPGEAVVGVVGSLYEVKGHKYLLQAACTVLKDARVTFLIVGRGEFEDALKSQTRNLGLDQKVRYLGFRSDVPRLIKLFDLFVLPSLSEGLSVAILEAMAAGIPVVTTAVGGNPELVVQGSTGILVPPRDSDALASAIIAMVTNANRRRAYGENGRQRIRERFSLEAMVRKYEAIYQAALSKTQHESGKGTRTLSTG